MPAVVRIDTGGTHGYQARIGGSVGYESKLFSDKKCGGKRKAKAAAIAWLEERGDRYAPRRFGPKKGIQANNVSGTPGVHESQLTRNGNVSRYWAAHYSIGPNGRRTHRSKRFYFGTKRTSDEARALAEEFRTGWVDAFESDGTDGVKRFFKRWDEKYPPRAEPRKSARTKAAAKTGKAQTAAKTGSGPTAAKAPGRKPAAERVAGTRKSGAADKVASATKASSRTSKAPAEKKPSARGSGTAKTTAKKTPPKPTAKKAASDKPAPTGRKTGKASSAQSGPKQSAQKESAAKKPAAKKTGSRKPATGKK